MELSPQQALGLRMSSLLLRASPGGAGRATGVAEVVTWLGAMLLTALCGVTFSR